jgi:hypothetical protein
MKRSYLLLLPGVVIALLMSVVVLALPAAEARKNVLVGPGETYLPLARSD